MGKMKTTEVGGTRVHLAGGPADDGIGPPTLVVLFHGYGAPGTDLVDLRRQLGAPTRVALAFPEGWQEVPEAGLPGQPGRAWWPIDMMSLQVNLWLSNDRERAEELLSQGLTAACARADALLTQLGETLGQPRDRMVIGGFSQGAILALSVALASSCRPRALVSLSGGCLGTHKLGERAAVSGPCPAFVAHGEEDPVLPFAGSVALKDGLEKAGWQVNWVPFPGGHTIGAKALDRLREFLAELSSAPAST